jgi:SAM-dependent methyltransferase
MRQSIKDFVTMAGKTLPIQGPLVEFGSLQVPGQESFADLRPYFPGLEYIGADMREGPGVDRILNLHDIDLPPESIGTVLCLDTLEHVEYPRRAMEQILKILKPGGVVIISSVMNYPIHDFPYDYWRFTPEAFKSLLQGFSGSFVGLAGKADFPHTVVGVGFKGTVPDMADFQQKFQEWQTIQEIHDRGPAIKRVVKLLTPPLFHPLLAKIYNCMPCGQKPTL